MPLAMTQSSSPGRSSKVARVTRGSGTVLPLDRSDGAPPKPMRDLGCPKPRGSGIAFGEFLVASPWSPKTDNADSSPSDRGSDGAGPAAPPMAPSAFGRPPDFFASANSSTEKSASLLPSNSAPGCGEGSVKKSGSRLDRFTLLAGAPVAFEPVPLGDSSPQPSCRQQAAVESINAHNARHRDPEMFICLSPLSETCFLAEFEI